MVQVEVNRNAHVYGVREFVIPATVAAPCCYDKCGHQYSKKRIPWTFFNSTCRVRELFKNIFINHTQIILLLDVDASFFLPLGRCMLNGRVKVRGVELLNCCQYSRQFANNRMKYIGQGLSVKCTFYVWLWHAPYFILSTSQHRRGQNTDPLCNWWTTKVFVNIIPLVSIPDIDVWIIKALFEF